MDQLAKLQRMTGERDTSMLSDYLEISKSVILNHRFPFGYKRGQEVEPQYEDLQVRIAHALYTKRGAEYESSRSVGGVSHGWSSEGVPVSLLREITPKCG